MGVWVWPGSSPLGPKMAASQAGLEWSWAAWSWEVDADRWDLALSCLLSSNSLLGRVATGRLSSKREARAYVLLRGVTQPHCNKGTADRSGMLAIGQAQAACVNDMRAVLRHWLQTRHKDQYDVYDTKRINITNKGFCSCLATHRAT